MSIDLYKAEAKRLAYHLADVHGVKLKHTSVLAAIAALHGARDWNTLIARDKPGLLKRAAAALRSPAKQDSVIKIDQLLFQVAPDGLRFGLSADSTTAVEVPDRLLRQHTLIVGPAGHGARVLLEHLAAQQLARGGGLLVLDTQPDARMPGLLSAAARHARREDLSGWAALHPAHELKGMRPVRYELMAGRDAAAIADRLLACLPAFPLSPGADFFREQCRFALTAILGAQLALCRPLSLSALCHLLERPQSLLSLRDDLSSALARAAEDTKTLEAALNSLNLLVATYTQPGQPVGVFDERSFQDTLGGLRGRLTLMAQPGALPYSDDAEARPLDLRSLIENGESAYLSLPVLGQGGTAHALTRMLLADLVAAVDQVRQGQSSRDSGPFLVVLPLTGSLAARLSSAFFAQARAMGIAFVLHAPSMTDLEDAGVAEKVLGNTVNKVFFKPNSPKELQAAAELLGFAYPQARASVKDSRDAFETAEKPMNWRDRLAVLQAGEALLVNQGRGQEIRICLLDSKD